MKRKMGIKKIHFKDRAFLGLAKVQRTCRRQLRRRRRRFDGCENVRQSCHETLIVRLAAGGALPSGVQSFLNTHTHTNTQTRKGL